MKKSLYNSVIEISDKKSIIYNALSDRFLIVKNHLENIWKNQNMEEIKEMAPFFYQELLNSQFIIDTNKDEKSELINAIDILRNESDTFRLIINPTLNCNFRCWYCYETHVKDSQVNKHTLDQIKEFIRKTVLNNELTSFDLSFFGGEPLLQYTKTVKPIISYTYDLCKKNNIYLAVGFTSNGYLINNGMIQFFKSCADSNFSFQVTIDGNEQDHNKVRFSSVKIPTYRKILENVEKLIENGIYVILRINFTKSNMFGIKDIIADLSKPIFKNNKLFHLDFHRVWQDNNDEFTNVDIENIISLFRKADIRTTYLTQSKIRNMCYAERKNEILINYNGDIFKCTAIDFMTQPRFGYLSNDGEIIWDRKKYSQWMDPSLNNNCLLCRIAPLCGGGCPNSKIKGREYCLYDFNENKKDKLILTRFENLFMHYDGEYTS